MSKPQPAADPTAPAQLVFSVVDDRLVVSGHLHIDALADLDRTGTRDKARGVAVIDMAGLTRIDTAGAWFLVDMTVRAARDNREITIEGATGAQAQLLDTVRRNLAPETPESARAKPVRDRLEAYGRTVAGGTQTAMELISFLGQVMTALGAIVVHPRRLRLISVVHHCQEVGLNAVPIVALMAFLIGVVLAFQGSVQLRQFGAEVFVVDLIAISVLRELGILLTAIIVAGRSASAFTATIGSMKMREEIDAMRTLGLDPAMVLFVPRILALLLMLPILGLVANVMGLLGGAIMSWIELGISPALFRTRLIEGTDISHVIVGMVKAPVFALIIGIVGCHAGMQVESNAESLGRMTSNAVVAAIFAVIVADALFSVFFAQIGM